jgi:hypothetical protein
MVRPSSIVFNEVEARAKQPVADIIGYMSRFAVTFANQVHKRPIPCGRRRSGLFVYGAIFRRYLHASCIETHTSLARWGLKPYELSAPT